MTEENSQVTPACLIYDQTCVMCKTFVKSVETAPNTRGFLFTPNSGALPAGVSVSEAQSQLIATDERGIVYKNSSAVAFVLGRKYRLPWLINFAELPILKTIFNLLYKLVAAQRHYIFGPTAALWWGKNIIVVGLWASVLISRHLWVGERFLPRVPLLGLPLNQLAFASLEYLLFSALIIFSVCVLLIPKRWPLLGTVGTLLIYVLFDLDRLQPWAFLYIIFLSLIAIYPFPDFKAPSNWIVRSLQVALGGVYFWSGVNKINLEFFTRIGPWFVAPLQRFTGGFSDFLPLLVWGIPFIEMLVGVILVWPRFARYGKFAAIGMHLFILFVIGPFNYNQNAVVWPWNLAMICLLLTLFNGENLLPVSTAKKYLTVFAILLFWLFPVLRFVGLADAYMSATLYSGSASSAIMKLDPNEPLPSELRAALVSSERGTTVVSLGLIAQNELNIPMYPEPRVFKNIFSSICSQLKYQNSAVLQIHPQPDFSNPPKVLEFHCSDFSS